MVCTRQPEATVLALPNSAFSVSRRQPEIGPGGSISTRELSQVPQIRLSPPWGPVVNI